MRNLQSSVKLHGLPKSIAGVANKLGVASALAAEILAAKPAQTTVSLPGLIDDPSTLKAEQAAATNLRALAKQEFGV